MIEHKGPCHAGMLADLPYKPIDLAYVRLDPGYNDNCLVRYQTNELELPEDWKGV